MRHIALATLLVLGMAPSFATADVELVAKNPSITDGGDIMVAGYDQKIEALNQTSDEISAAIFSKKSLSADKKDGVQVALIKIGK